MLRSDLHGLVNGREDDIDFGFDALGLENRESENENLGYKSKAQKGDLEMKD